MEIPLAEHERIKARLARLESVHAVGQIIHSTLDLKEAMHLLLREAVRLLSANSGTVSLANPTTGFLELEAIHGFPPSTRGLRLKIGEGITGWVARSGKSARVGNVANDRRYIRIRADICSELAVPLRVGDTVRGVINLNSDRLDAFSADDEELLQELAQVAAPAIANTWLYEQARQKARLLESLVTVSQTINSTISLDDALQAVVRETRALLGGRMCSLMMLDATGEWLELRAHYGAGKEYLSKPRLNAGESFVGIAMRRKKPMQLENVQKSGRYQNSSMARKEGLVSLLTVPLLFSGKALGALNLYTGEPHTFADEEVRTLTAYAELSALALEKTRLYDRIVQVEEALRQSERLSALGLLAAEIAHEIRNPLTVMKMLHHSLALDFPADDARSNDVRIMGEKMDHLNRIVDRVLDFARSAEPQRSEVNLNQLLDDMSLLTRHALQVHNVALIRKFDQSLPTVWADATQLEQAFLNLTLNAVEAMPDGGRLTIRSKALPLNRGAKRPSHVLVRFRDTGAGMSAEQRKRAFSSLLQTTKPKGTGLGLAIVARVIEQHQGLVKVWSTPGRGTTISMVLPLGK